MNWQNRRNKAAAAHTLRPDVRWCGSARVCFCVYTRIYYIIRRYIKLGTEKYWHNSIPVICLTMKSDGILSALHSGCKNVAVVSARMCTYAVTAVCQCIYVHIRIYHFSLCLRLTLSLSLSSHSVCPVHILTMFYRTDYI